MQAYGLHFHHFGLAVAQPREAVAFLSAIGYDCGSVVRDPLQHVNLIFCTCRDMPAVEIVFPTDEPGPLQGLLTKREELIYHLCYETSDLESSLEMMRADGRHLLCVSPAKSAVLFDGKLVSFHLLKGFGLIELIQR